MARLTSQKVFIGFQFLVVRLKEVLKHQERLKMDISIPCGSIKSLIHNITASLNGISIPCGSIKRRIADGIGRQS